MKKKESLKCGKCGAEFKSSEEARECEKKSPFFLGQLVLLKGQGYKGIVFEIIGIQIILSRFFEYEIAIMPKHNPGLSPDKSLTTLKVSGESIRPV